MVYFVRKNEKALAQKRREYEGEKCLYCFISKKNEFGRKSRSCFDFGFFGRGSKAECI